MSFASKVLYTGDGVVKSFNIPMPYLSASHLKVFVDQILQLNPMNYTLSGASTVLFGTAPGDGASVEIRRHTSPTATLVDFVDGSVLNENDLDTAYLHNYYLGQEYSDSFNEVINNIFLQYAGDFGILETETDAIINALTQEMLSGDSAAELQARITDIDANAEAIITLGEALQLQINTLASGVAAAVYIQDDEPIPGVGGIPDPITDGARWYDSDDNNHPYIYILGDLEWVSIDDPRIGQAVSDINVLEVTVDHPTTGVAANTAAIVDEAFARATEDTAFASTIALLGAETDAGAAFLLDMNTVKVGASETLASRFSTITASWTAADVTAVADAALASESYTDAEITTEQSVRANADGAFADTFTLMGAENAGGTAFILDEDTVKIASDGGDTVAERFTGIAADINGNSGDITTIQTVTIPGVETDVGNAQNAADAAQSYGEGVASDLGDFEADVLVEYGVDLTANGYVSGFRLINGGTPGASAFVILADKFAIVDPSGDPGETEYTPMQIVGGKVRFNANVEIDGDLVVSGTINGADALSTTVAHRIGSTQIGADAIYSTHIGADQIVSAHILAGEITASHMTITGGLAAITADLGSITAGNITLDTSGYIRGGQTAFATGSGFFLGYESGEYQFSIGDAIDNSLTWDGTTLKVIGDVIVGTWVPSATNSTIEMNVEDTGNSAAHGAESAVFKSFTADRDGSVRLYCSGYYTSTGGPPEFPQEDPDYWEAGNEPRTVVYVNDIEIDDITHIARYNSYGTTSLSALPVLAGDVVTLTVKGGRFWDRSTAGWQNVIAIGGYCRVYADVKFIGNTVNLDS